MKSLFVFYPPDMDIQPLKKAFAKLPLIWKPQPPVNQEKPSLWIQTKVTTPPPEVAIAVMGDQPIPEHPRIFGFQDTQDVEAFGRGLFKVIRHLQKPTYEKEFIEIGIALSAEKDIDRLLSLILTRARQLSDSDAGSLYLVQEEGDEKYLLFKLAQNDSLRISLAEKKLPVTNNSIAGHVALSGETLMLEDAYQIDSRASYHLDPTFDQTYGYHTKSMLVLPMKNHQGEIIGVLQLINRKKDPEALLTDREAVERWVIPYSPEQREQLQALANMAAVAIENSQLLRDIQKLFEGFVAASVTAIEQRDPSTKGHSLRVSILTVALAEAWNKTIATRPSGLYLTDTMLQELRWAALLHDFGKVGVREHVLIKAKKLYPHELERIAFRKELIKKSILLDHLRRERAYWMEKGTLPPEKLAQRWEKEKQEKLQKLEAFFQTILRANEPTVLPEGDFTMLKEIEGFVYQDQDGEVYKLLEPQERAVLSIPKGSLSEEERLEIESHATHTYAFLKQIPWTKPLRHIPTIAWAHHEKLNGKGYPRGLTAEQIPLQSKMMTVADIFDALSAADRPYKKAVPVEKALDILRMEARDGFIASDLVELFIEAEIWRKTLHLRQVSS